MAEFVDSLAVAVERSNIFAVPEVSRDSAGTTAEPARTMGVFARFGSGSATAGGTDWIPQPRARFSPTAACRRAAVGVSTRSSVCVAVVVAAVMAGLVLHELSGPRADPRVQLNARPAVGVEARPLRVGAAEQRVANQKTRPSRRRRADSRRSRSRESSAQRPRAAVRMKTCCPAGESKRRSLAAVPSARLPGLSAPSHVPATPVTPFRAPAAPQNGAAPAPVPAGTPPEFM